MYDSNNEQALLKLEADIDSVYQATKGSYDSAEEAWEAALSTVRILSQRWPAIPTRKALIFMDELSELMEEEGLDRPTALRKLGEVKGQEFELQGAPYLKIHQIEYTRNGSVIRSLLLGNGDLVILRLQANENRPNIYDVQITGAGRSKGGRQSFLMNNRKKLEITGMESGETMLIGIDPESAELTVEYTR